MTIPKFRAWLKDEYRMTDVREITFFDDEVQMISDVTDFYTYGEFELMQSTGLVDENGEELFEGDVIATNSYGYLEYGRVFYSSETASFRVAFVDEVLDLDEVECDYVAGNIYENPELLEED